VELRPRPQDVIRDVRLIRKIDFTNREVKHYIIYPSSERIPTLKRLVTTSLSVVDSDFIQQEFGLTIRSENIPIFRIQFWECRTACDGPVIHWWINIHSCACKFSNNSHFENWQKNANLYYSEFDRADTPHRFAYAVNQFQGGGLLHQILYNILQNAA